MIKEHSLLWWFVALIVGVPLTIIVVVKIIWFTLFILPFLLIGAVIFGFVRGMLYLSSRH